MHITITPYRIHKEERNRVTSAEPLKKNQHLAAREYEYDPDGIFSERIFGKPYRCKCGALTEPGVCELCKTRVFDIHDVPDYYIDLGMDVVKLYADFSDVADVKSVLTYEAFVYDDEDEGCKVIPVDIDTDMSEYEYDRIHIGIDGARLVNPDAEKWAQRYMTDFVSVPHPSSRPNVKRDDGSLSFSPINKALMSILEDINSLNNYREIFNATENEFDEKFKKEFILYLLSYSKEISKCYLDFMREIYYLFAKRGKESYIGSELRGHRISGAIRGTVVNRYDVDEDIILIGDTFISTLYPVLYHECEGDMERINDALIDTNAFVLVNRPPTIGHYSIMALKPRVASCYKYGTFSDGAKGKNRKSENTGEIDMLGIRTVAINPIICDGFAGDFDGDTLFVIALYGKKAKKEAATMLPSVNYMNYSNGEIRNAIIEDFEFIR